MDRLAEQTDTRLRFRAEVLAGSWECLEDGRADLLISPQCRYRHDRHQAPGAQEEVMLYVAHPDHPLHQEPEPLADETLRRYRAIAVADTALRKPVLTYRLLDKQPRLTVSTMGRSGTPCWRGSASAPCRNAGLKRTSRRADSR